MDYYDQEESIRETCAGDPAQSELKDESISFLLFVLPQNRDVRKTMKEKLTRFEKKRSRKLYHFTSAYFINDDLRHIPRQ